jgi:hypothetical protein
VDLGSGDNVKPAAISVSAWAYSTQTALQVLLARQRSYTQETTYGLSQRSASTMYFTVGYNIGLEYQALSNNALQNVWQHWLGSYDGKTIRLYLDGIAQTSYNYTGSLLYTNDYPTKIGNYFSPYHWQGRIRDVRIYNYAVDPSTVKQIWSNPNGLTSDNPPIAYWIQSPWLSIAEMTCDPTANALALTTSALLTLSSLNSNPICTAFELSAAVQMLLADIDENPQVGAVTIQQAAALLCLECFGRPFADAAIMDDAAFLSVSAAVGRPTNEAAELASALWLVLSNPGATPSAVPLSLSGQLALALAQATSSPVADTLELQQAITLLITEITGLPRLDAVALGGLLIGLGKLINPNLKIATLPLSLHSATPTHTIRRA